VPGNGSTIHLRLPLASPDEARTEDRVGPS
jgi:hypothetical protein